MSYKPSEREVAGTVKEIEERSWPFHPLLPMKQYQEAGKFPRTGVLLKGQLNKVFMIGLHDALKLTGAGKQSIVDMKDPPNDGFGHVSVEAENYNQTADTVAESLKDVPCETYENLEALIRAGWLVD